MKKFFTSAFYLPSGKNKKFKKQLAKIIGFNPGNLLVYQLAFTHKTFNYQQGRHKLEPKKILPDNERLEFLGDAVLDLIIAEILFIKFPYKGEGFLTEMRSKMVSRDKLGKIANKMGLVTIIDYDKSISIRPGQLETMGGNALEALVGAIYIDKGYKKVYQFIRDRIIEPHMDFRELEESEISYKAKMMEWAQKNKAKLSFNLSNEIRKGKNTYYEIQLVIDEKVIATDTNFSKKKAEELAAEKGWNILFPQV